MITSISEACRSNLAIFLNVFVMSSTDSSIEASSFVSENEYESEFDEIFDVESGECSKSIGQTSSNNAMAASSDNDSYAWADDPVADDEWTENYEEEMTQQGILQETLMRRLDGSTQLWVVSFDINKVCKLYINI